MRRARPEPQGPCRAAPDPQGPPDPPGRRGLPVTTARLARPALPVRSARLGLQARAALQAPRAQPVPSAQQAPRARPVQQVQQVPAGPAGPAGPSGSQLVTGTPTVVNGSAARNTFVTATATCPAEKVLLGGGARVTTTQPQTERAQLVQSYPSAVNTWTAVGVVAIGNITAANTMTVTAYALCSL